MNAPNSVVVRKYGGTSVGSPDRIRKVARDLVENRSKGFQQVVVVSAMAQTTDQLLGLAYQVARQPRARELDMLLTTGEQVSSALLAMAVYDLGVSSIALTGAQCGIRTDKNFSRAKIEAIDTDRLFNHLKDDRIVIVAGFQGVTSEQEITTLGRGGSDTTATAIAAALGGCSCQIFTDVDGVFTADPRIVPEAKLLNWIGYGEMLEYAAAGSRVLHPRCVEIAAKFHVPLEVRSSFHNESGTRMIGEDDLEKATIIGVTGDSSVARVAMTLVKDQPGIAATITESLSEYGINVRLIIQGLRHDNRSDVSLIIDQVQLEKSVEVLSSLTPGVDATDVKSDAEIAMVAIIGSGISGTPGVAGRMFRALANEKVNIDLISSSEAKILCIIRQERLDDAVRAIHREFELDKLERQPNEGYG
jgi:aspartate kinase